MCQRTRVNWRQNLAIVCFHPVENKQFPYTIGLAAACWAIWLARNRATFKKRQIKMPFEIVFPMYSFIIYWTGLQNDGGAKELRGGAEMIRAGTMNLMKMCNAMR